MEECSARAIHSSGIDPVKRQNVPRLALIVIEVQVGERFPPPPQADNFAIDFASPIDNAFDRMIEAGDIAAARQNTDAFRHAHSLWV